MRKATSEVPQRMLSMNPHKFALWLLMVTIAMMFAALTSAYIVKKSGGQWLQYELPSILWANAVVLLLSSTTMQGAYFSAKKNRFKALKAYLLITLFLALLFLIGQYQAWKDLVAIDVYLVGNPAGSFIYIFTGLHAVHLISGIIFILFVLVAVLKKNVHSKRMLRIEMCTTYWHFLDALWLYLFSFLLLNH